MARVQLALNVSDLDEAVSFYSRLFETVPAKRRDGYANFEIDAPPLKLVLIESSAAPGTLNHLGVEVPDSSEVAAAQRRLAATGLATTVEEQVDCCHAIQDKVWVDAPDGMAWEVYTVLSDSNSSAGLCPHPDGADCRCGPTTSIGVATPTASTPDAGCS